jgi:hypothetical protein
LLRRVDVELAAVLGGLSLTNVLTALMDPGVLRGGERRCQFDQY